MIEGSELLSSMPLLPSSRWPAPSQRLRVKTTVVQVAVVGADPGAESDPTKGKEVYLVSFSHPTNTHSACGKALVAPESLARAQILEKFLVSCALVRTRRWE